MIVVGMFCMAYAAFPLYSLFCKVTGYAGTPKQVDVGSVVKGKKKVNIRFNADVNPNLQWQFKPVQKQVRVQTGENMLAFFEAENMSDKPVSGIATFNVTPDKAATYFSKIQCFCFDEQRLEPGEKVMMPVSFFVDPEIETDPNTKEVSTLTLSYTFFPLQEK